MKATFVRSDELTPNIKTFWFEPEEKLRFTAGQFTELYIPHDNADDRGERRWFTISSSPTKEHFSITTKFAGDKGSTFKKALLALEPGDTVEAQEAMGDFVLPKLVQTPLVVVAGGIGLTPFHSMFEWLADVGETRDIKFIYAVRSEDDIVFQDTFERAGIEATIIVGEPSDEWGGLTGRLTADDIKNFSEITDDTLVYISGPEGMVADLKADLIKDGVPKQQVVTDDFPGYTNI
jgi:ferredoxin-NADP reductase